jgi:hypothetical protein
MKEASESIRNAYRDALEIFGLSREVKALEKLSMRSDAFSQKINHAPYDYSPLMNVTKIDESTMIKFMEFDASIADLIKELKEKVEILKNDLQDNVLDAKKVRDIENAMRALEAAFNERDNVLMTVLGD